MKLRPRTPLTNADFALACHADFMVFAEAAWAIVNPGKEFVPGLHMEAIAHVLEQTERGELKRLGICMPPRYGKSFLSSVAFPAWLLGRDPTKQIVCVSYANDLAEQHAADCKALMASAFYKEVFPATRIDIRHSADTNFMTTKRGRRIATTVDGTLTGRGGQYIIVDDPMKPQDAFSDRRRTRTHNWWDNTLTQRLDSKQDDVIIVVMQRVHVDDTIARVKAKGTFHILTLPAIATHDEDIPLSRGRVFKRRVGEALHPAREPLPVLEALREEITPAVFEAQYQQNPSAGNDAIIRWEQIHRYDTERETFRTVPNEDYFVISWDTAAKTGERNDWTVGSVWFVKKSVLPPGSQRLRKARFYLVEIIRGKYDFDALIARMVDAHNQYRPKMHLIEDTLQAPALASALAWYHIHRAELVRPNGDKKARLYSQAGWFSRGQVAFPTTAPWIDALKEEWEPFPHGVHDDQVDSISQFLSWVFEMSENEVVSRSL